MDAGPVFAEVPADPEDYLLDLDADAGVEDFDFKLDGMFEDEAQNSTVEANATGPTDAGPDFEIGYEEEEAQTGLVEKEQTEINDAAQDAGEDAGIDYQDEIGYEDEESAVAEVIDTGKGGTGGAGTPTVWPTGDSAELDDHQEASDFQAQTLDRDQGTLDGQELEFAVSGGNLLQDGFGGQDEEATSEVNDTVGLSAMTTDDGSTHQSFMDHEGTPASHPDDFENGTSNGSDASSTLPEVLVHYNQGQYSLIGARDDDPDSYFLSDESSLDGSLSQLLASIRAVISDEVSSRDELLIRIDSLDFEFGEKSSKTFLDRPFRDILKCFTALAANPSRLAPKDSNSLDLELLIRRDCEDRFLELLADAGFAKGGSHQADHPRNSEGPGDATSSKHEGDGEVYDESSVDGYSEGYELEVDAAAVPSGGDPSQVVGGEEKSLEQPTASENLDDNMGDTFDLEVNLGVPEPAELAGFGEENFEGQDDDGQYLAYDSADGPGSAEGELADDDVDISADLEDEYAADPTNEGSEFTFDIPDQSVEDVDEHDRDDEAGTRAGFDFGELDATDVVGATTEQGSTSNDVDLEPSLDSEAAVPTESHENNGPVNGDGPAQAETITSNHTSRTSTINGDHIEAQDLAVEFSVVDADSRQDADTIGDQNDEIDWENDGDENEDQNQAAETTPSVSGKRSRTNELESLDDEADYKRRRT